jgi:hypothetical protein
VSKKLSFPNTVRDEVLRELYKQAELADWELMNSPQKSQQYARWIDDPAIGGRLTQFHTAEDVRVWLKDVPMKEYARALDGVGPYAEYTSKRLSDISELIRRALGDQWTVVPGTLGEKPLHCSASDGTHVRYVCWGKPGTFRDLVWAAVKMAIKIGNHPMVIVSIRDGQDVNGEERREHERIAAHCGVDIRHIHRRLVTRDDL